MSSSADNLTPPAPQTVAGGRRRDAQASRRALLDAAGALFDARGYEATTIREIGERAGVDAALIARYFGGKEGLYLATLAEADPPAPAGEPLEVVERLLRRSEARGLGPVTLAMVSPTLTEAMRAQVAEIVATRLSGPLAAQLEARGTPDAQLRAELVVALAIAVTLTRPGGTLPALHDAAVADLLATVRPAVDALTGTGA